MMEGSRSVFGPEPWSETLAARLAAFDIHPSAPLWGRGDLRSTGEARRLEEAALSGDSAQALRAGLEAAGMRQERRPTRLRPAHLSWHRPAGEAVLELAFELPPGAYATTVLAALGAVSERPRSGRDRSSETQDPHWPATGAGV
jgi:tRNA pseudouridine13 synthase